MKEKFIEAIRSLCRLFVTCLAWVFSAITFLSSKASYHLTILMVNKETRDIFDAKDAAPDYRQKLYDLLDSESEPLVGFIREMTEKTRPGQLAVRHVSQRHDYAVLNPSKQENIRRILNVFDTFPKAAYENSYIMVERAINGFKYSGESKDEETTL